MNIIVVSTWHPYPPSNGSKLRAYYLLRALARKHYVNVISFCPPADQTAAPEIDRRVKLHAVTADPFRYTRLPQGLKYLSPVPLAYWPVPEMKRVVHQIGLTEKWDAVIALQMPVAQYALQLDAHVRILDIDTSLSYWDFEVMRPQRTRVVRLRHWLRWQKGYIYEKSLGSRFDTVTLVSSIELDYLQHMLATSQATLELVPNGVDCEHNQPVQSACDPDALVFNGSLTYSANYDAVRWFLTEVYPEIRSRRPSVSLTITGSTKGVDLDGLALHDSVHLTGYVDDVRMPVAQAAVCIIPLWQGGGTRLKILEAMALGTPVISTSKGAEGLDVVNGEHLLLADEPPEFAARTAELLDNPPLRHRLAANARRLVEQCYDWAQIGAAFVQLVEQTVAAKRGPR